MIRKKCFYSAHQGRVKAHYLMYYGIVPNLIELPMKYDELHVDHQSGVIFQNPDTQFCMPKVYEELAFVLENRKIPRSEMDNEIKKHLNL